MTRIINPPEPYQQELPFTKVPNVFLDEWVNVLGLLEIRIVAAIIRRTFGWHRTQSGALPVSTLCQITRRSKPLVIKALASLRQRGIVTGTRISRHEAMSYGLIMRREFRPLIEAPPPELQGVLPYDVIEFRGKENLTSEGMKPLPLSGKENLTSEAPGLICIKERDLKDTHTKETPAPVEKMPVCVGSRFKKEIVTGYAWAQHNYVLRWNRSHDKSQHIGGIKNPDGWAKVAHKTGDHDAEIEKWLDDPGMFEFAVNY